MAGFSLVREIGTNENNQTIYSMAEFFVMKKYRKLGVGQHAATELFNKLKGTWKVAQIEANIPAQIFWKKTIEKYTKNNYQEVREEDWKGPVQIFST